MAAIEKKSNKFEEIAKHLADSTILITGASGMMGQNIVRILTQMNDEMNADIKIVAHARSLEKAEKVFAEYTSRSDFQMYISDIVNFDFDGDVDYIIHTAGVTGGSKQHVDFPMRTISVALDGTRRVLDVALSKKAKGVVYLSSLEAYGNTGVDKTEIFETDGGYIDPVNVRSSYSESKRMCECMCASYTKQYGLPTYIARLTATFGYGVAYNDNRVFAQFARSIIEKNDIVLKSTGETVRNYCDAEDAAMALLLMFVNGVPGEAYNVANMNAEISIKDLAEKFITLFPESNISLKFDLGDDAAKLGYIAVMRNVINSEKLMSIGWEPVYSMDEMIIRLVNSLKKEEN